MPRKKPPVKKKRPSQLAKATLVQHLATERELSRTLMYQRDQALDELNQRANLVKLAETVRHLSCDLEAAVKAMRHIMEHVKRFEEE